MTVDFDKLTSLIGATKDEPVYEDPQDVSYYGIELKANPKFGICGRLENHLESNDLRAVKLGHTIRIPRVVSRQPSYTYTSPINTLRPLDSDEVRDLDEKHREMYSIIGPLILNGQDVHTLVFPMTLGFTEALEPEQSVRCFIPLCEYCGKCVIGQEDFGKTTAESRHCCCDNSYKASSAPGSLIKLNRRMRPLQKAVGDDRIKVKSPTDSELRETHYFGIIVELFFFKENGYRGCSIPSHKENFPQLVFGNAVEQLMYLSAIMKKLEPPFSMPFSPALKSLPQPDGLTYTRLLSLSNAWGSVRREISSYLGLKKKRRNVCECDVTMTNALGDQVGCPCEMINADDWSKVVDRSIMLRHNSRKLHSHTNHTSAIHTSVSTSNWPPSF